MVMKWTCLCLVALALLGSLCDGQGYMPHYQKPAPPQPQPKDPIKQQPRDPVQQKQSFEAPLTWTYPEDPQPEPQPEVPFQLREPIPPETVAVECRENIAHVEVKRDMFGTGQLINPNDIQLGGCAAVGEDTAAQVVILESELHGCGSTSMMTNDYLVYSFVLYYEPRPVGGVPVVRTTASHVVIECHYPRKHNVSSLPLDPVWNPFSAVKIAEEFLYFTLKLMMDDWQYERPIYQYFLGQVINIEATVKQFYHVPLRVFVDSCVASVSPDINSNPRYAFIENHGCLVDAAITGSSSQFLPRTAENKLRFQLEAFRFQGVESGVMYITCNLKATSTNMPIDTEYRACSYTNGWQEASGVNGVCGTCEGAGAGAGAGLSGGGVASAPSQGASASWTTGGGRKVRSVPDPVYEGVVSLAISIGEEAGKVTA